MDFKNINSADELSDLLSKKALSHTVYAHYSSLYAINSILESKTFRLGSMCFSNDGNEQNTFGEDTCYYFQLCFASGTSENLPMWFLYSGTNGDGGRLSFKLSFIKKLMAKTDINLVEFGASDNNDKSNVINRRPLKETEYEKIFNDMVYREAQSSTYRLKYNGEIKNGFSEFEWDRYYFGTNKAFVKDIVWFYEKESRLLIKLNKDLIDPKRFVGRKTAPYCLEISFSNLDFSKITFTFSPKYSFSEQDSYKTAMKDYPYIEELIVLKSLSKYHGQVKIDLCRNCNKCKDNKKN